MSMRYVVQHHQSPHGDHYDLMFEQAEALATFRLSRPLHEMPLGQAEPVDRLADHRKAYLTYEGPVSGDRGRVQLVDSGTYEPVDGGRGELRLAGRRFAGVIRIGSGTSGEKLTIMRRDGP